MLDILKSSHSGLRWIALILLLVAIGNAFSKKGSGSYVKRDKMINLFAMVFLHVQILLGLILYKISPRVNFNGAWMKSSEFRFFGMEHILMMVIAVIVVTIGRRKAENETNPAKKHSKIITWYIIGLIIILAAIPWPFRNVGITSWI